jgi:hypothetical protein
MLKGLFHTVKHEGVEEANDHEANDLRKEIWSKESEKGLG